MQNRLLLLMIIAAALAGCSKAPVEHIWMTMGTFASVSVADEDAAGLDEAAEFAVTEFERLERLWSTYNPESEICRLNRASGGEMIRVSQETEELLVMSRALSSSTDGCFDPTVGPLVDLWGIDNSQEFSIPPEEDIKAALNQCGWTGIHVEGDQNEAGLSSEGMSFDSGGIGKGLAVDMVYDELIKRGFKNLMVNLGGNMRCGGAGRNGKAWSIGVRDPFIGEDIAGVIELTDGMAAATSGNYERFIEKNGRRFAHIIDPVTGWPVEGMAGVTVVAPNAAEADALSTALFVAGVDKGQRILERFPEAKAIFIEDARPIVLKVSPGMDKMLKDVSEGVSVQVLGGQRSEDRDQKSEIRSQETALTELREAGRGQGSVISWRGFRS